MTMTMTMTHTMRITAADGAKFSAYVAVPASGSGPAIVLLQEIFGVNAYIRGVADRYAEEGYVVLAPDIFHRLEPDVELAATEADFPKAFAFYEALDIDLAVSDVVATVAAARALPEVTASTNGAGVGVLGFCLGGKLAFLAAAATDVDCVVCYYGGGIDQCLDKASAITAPLMMHFGEADEYIPPDAIARIRERFAERPRTDIHVYRGAGHAFARPGHHHDASAAALAYTRSLAVFRQAIGPRYDLGAIADYHFYLEFEARDPDTTMTTMVPQPYVNHVPTMTGGVGFEMLHRFYKNHFIGNNPPDMRMVGISRTIGTDRMVDEFVMCFTHTTEVDWLLPNVAPTGRVVEIPMVAIVTFRGDKLFNEHIYWDQASVLVQVGLLDPSLVPAIAGVEQARKLLDPSLPSNTLMARWATSG
jgi:carboxymethylenebutenolidase